MCQKRLIYQLTAWNLKCLVKLLLSLIVSVQSRIVKFLPRGQVGARVVAIAHLPGERRRAERGLLGGPDTEWLDRRLHTVSHLLPKVD